MDWIAPLFGGVTGLVGTGLTYLMDYFKRKQDAQARAEEAKHNVTLAELEVKKLETMTAGNIQQAVIAGDTAFAIGSQEADKATYAPTLSSDTPVLVKYLLGFVDFLRGFIRPGTTIGYGALFAWLVVLAVSAVGAKELAGAQSSKLIDAAIYLATTTTLWWFGVRPLNKDKGN